MARTRFSFAPAAALAHSVAAFAACALLASPPPAHAAGAVPPPSTPAVLSPDAPERYTVQPRDTLWDLAQRFLNTPWVWPDIWHANPQVKNPHLIYPGDVLVITTVNGQPSITLERGDASAVVRLSPEVRSTPIGDAIPSIPYEVVAAFMSRPSVVSTEDLERRPYVLTLKGGRLVGAAGSEVYARRLGKAALGARYNIVHAGAPLRDPDTGKVIGYEGIYTGSGRIEKTGDPATLLITESARESLKGDLLYAEKLDVPLDFVPHAPKRKVSGRIMSVVDGVSVIGQYQVVAINLGREHGMEPGHVLSIRQSNGVVRDTGPKRPPTAWTAAFREGFAKRLKLPEEQMGLFLVFKAADHLSYGLVVQASGPLRVGDAVGNP